MTRPTEPEGFAAAVRRLRWDLHNLRHWSAAMRKDARADLGHALINAPVEWCREKGVPWPKMVGKAIAVMIVGVPVMLAVWVALALA